MTSVTYVKLFSTRKISILIILVVLTFSTMHARIDGLGDVASDIDIVLYNIDKIVPVGYDKEISIVSNEHVEMKGFMQRCNRASSFIRILNDSVIQKLSLDIEYIDSYGNSLGSSNVVIEGVYSKDIRQINYNLPTITGFVRYKSIKIEFSKVSEASSVLCFNTATICKFGVFYIDKMCNNRVRSVYLSRLNNCYITLLDRDNRSLDTMKLDKFLQAECRNVDFGAKYYRLVFLK